MTMPSAAHAAMVCSHWGFFIPITGRQKLSAAVGSFVAVGFAVVVVSPVAATATAAAAAAAAIATAAVLPAPPRFPPPWRASSPPPLPPLLRLCVAGADDDVAPVRLRLAMARAGGVVDGGRAARAAAERAAREVLVCVLCARVHSRKDASV